MSAKRSKLAAEVAQIKALADDEISKRLAHPHLADLDRRLDALVAVLDAGEDPGAAVLEVMLAPVVEWSRARDASPTKFRHSRLQASTRTLDVLRCAAPRDSKWTSKLLAALQELRSAAADAVVCLPERK